MNSLISERDLNEWEDSSANTLLESIDLSNISYLCVHYSEGKCGATLYHSNTNHIQVINELEDNDFDSLESLLLQTEPNHVIISSKSDPKLIELLKSCAKGKEQLNDSSNMDSEPTKPQSSDRLKQMQENTSSALDLMWKIEFEFDVHIISFNLFKYESAKNRILSIKMKNDINSRDETQKILYFSTYFDFSDNNTLKSFGALLRFLDSNAFDVETNRSTAEISDINCFYLKQLVTIERNTYESLQIFQQEWHPSAAKQGINQKEGISLYGLFNCCVSKIGAKIMRKWFLLPTQEIDIIMDRLKSIEFFIEPNHHILRDNLNLHLKNIKSVIPLFNRLMISATLTISDYQILYNNLWNALRIRDIIVQQTSDLQVFREIKSSFTEDLDRMVNAFAIIDYEKTIRSQSFEINYGIDEELDRMKNSFSDLPHLLAKVAQNEVQTYGQILDDCNCVYIPQLGFLTSVRKVEHILPPHQISEEFRYLVEVGDRYYYKTPHTSQLDQSLGDIQSDIIDRQIAIINQFYELLVEKKKLFFSITKCCAKLDALIAMSRTALTYHFKKPNITIGESIEIIEGRHALIELISNGFIPNDYLSGGQHKKAKLISGPNACGKSVYLKQICLIVYLVHIGSYVPAHSANVPIVDRIFSRIHTPESISLRLSTFMLDLKQMSNATKNATKRSLVVIDEFGKGTQPIDGLALMAACVEHWLTNVMPHLVVSSHFRCLPAIVSRNELIDCQTFEFSKSVNGLQYLFKLKEGHFKESIAAEVALIAGVPDPIVNRGIKICHSMAGNETIDCYESEQMKLKYKSYEGISKKFIRLNITSKEEVKDFFNSNFCEYSTSEE